MDAIDFLRKKYCVPGDKMLADVVGARIPTDLVIRMLDEYVKSYSGANAGYASPSSQGVQNGEQWQKCPKCDGQGMVSKPPWVAGDVNEWTGTQTSYPCDLCGGMKVIKQ